jgi:hypothetical protein
MQVQLTSCPAGPSVPTRSVARPSQLVKPSPSGKAKLPSRAVFVNGLFPVPRSEGKETKRDQPFHLGGTFSPPYHNNCQVTRTQGRPPSCLLPTTTRLRPTHLVRTCQRRLCSRPNPLCKLGAPPSWLQNSTKLQARSHLRLHAATLPDARSCNQTNHFIGFPLTRFGT